MNESNVPRESDRIRYKFLGLILSAMFATLATSGCCRCPGNAADSRESPRPEAVSGPAAAVQTTTYHSIGVVKSTNVKLSSIEIQHQDIPGLMPAMTMEFYVKDKSLLEGVKAGDRIDFILENGVAGLRVVGINKL